MQNMFLLIHCSVIFVLQGDRIQASVKQKLLRKFQNDLPEGEFRDIVLANDRDYRAKKHPCKINFLFTTCVKRCDVIPKIPRFDFCAFSDIIAQSNDTDVFIDILGEIVGMDSQVKEKNLLRHSI
ncbi:unnamed protein product [Arabis nemorensis]|uniref:Uncharacterized protein n=1 Tax=Arabis nemorensis TaxID=586526 RepID=A0A565B6Z2_9BRAS|nr:unnamed protein product [Arabis nemorensis]